jgi:hypothetical protein
MLQGCGAWPPRSRWPSALPLSGSLVPVAVGAVAVVLILGLINMLRGGSANTSQNLMRLRVVLQFTAIVIILFVMWWRSG